MYSLITNRVYDIFTFDNTIQISEIKDEIADLKAYYNSTFDFYINSLESVLKSSNDNEVIDFERINYNLKFLKDQKN